VYINKPHTIQQLKDNICAEIRGLQPELLSAVMENAVERACLCEAENGGQISCSFYINKANLSLFCRLSFGIKIIMNY